MSTSKQDLAPIALFVFNRPEHTLRTLSALKKNTLARESHLFVFSDGPRQGKNDESSIHDVRSLLNRENWCGKITITAQNRNLGLANSIKSGVNRVLSEYEKIIVLEDDIETAPSFLTYMNHGLNLYDQASHVTSICSYLPQSMFSSLLPNTFLVPYMSCWGWATWRRAWNLARWDAKSLLAELEAFPGGIRRFNLDGMCHLSRQLEDNLTGRLNTWAIFWAASSYLAHGNSLYPKRSLSRNCGFDNSGEHCHQQDKLLYDVKLPEHFVVSDVKLKKASALGWFYLKDFHRWGPNKTLMQRIKLSVGLTKHKIAKSLKKA